MHRLLPVIVIVCASCGPDRLDWPQECPNPGRDDVRYVHETWADRRVCLWADFVCPEGTEALYSGVPEFQGNDCGCGCTGDPDLLGDIFTPPMTLD